MSEYSRPRSALMTNLPKQGWEVDKEAATGEYKELRAKFNEDHVLVTKVEGDGEVEVGTVSYGKSQMADMKKLAAGAGIPFGKAKGGGGGGSKLTPEQKKERQKKAAAKRAAKMKEKNVTKKEPGEGKKEETSSDDEKEGV